MKQVLTMVNTCANSVLYILGEHQFNVKQYALAVGEIDRMWERQGVGADAAPAFDTLVGKTLELRWKYFDQGKPVRGRFSGRLPHLTAWECT